MHLPDRRQERVVGRDEAALGLRGTARQAGDRRDDVRVAQVQLDFAELRLGGAHVGRGELGVRRRVVGFLLTDRLALGERLEPRGFAIGLRLLRLRPRDLGLGSRRLRLQRLGIDDEQALPLFHGGALLEELLLEDAGDARAHLDFLRAGRLTHVFVRHGNGLRRHDGRGDLRRRHPVKAALLLRRAAAGEQREGQSSGGGVRDGTRGRDGQDGEGHDGLRERRFVDRGLTKIAKITYIRECLQPCFAVGTLERDRESTGGNR